jgi:streptomycin 6-kinase
MHEGLAWFEGTEEGRDWLARLPAIVDACAQEWSLTLGEPFVYAFASLAMPAEREDDSAAVLKVQFPDREANTRPPRWRHGRRGAVRLLAYDEDRRALLLGAPSRGRRSGAGDGRGTRCVRRSLPRSWKPAGSPFRPLADEPHGGRGPRG